MDVDRIMDAGQSTVGNEPVSISLQRMPWILVQAINVDLLLSPLRSVLPWFSKFL